MAYNKAKAERQRFRWKEAEEKELRKLGVDEDTIQRLHTYDWAQFNKERQYLQRQVEWSPFVDLISTQDIELPVEDPLSCKHLPNTGIVVADFEALQTHIQVLSPISSLPYQKSGCFPNIPVSNNLYLQACISPQVCKPCPYVAAHLSHILLNSLHGDRTRAQNIFYSFLS